MSYGKRVAVAALMTISGLSNIASAGRVPWPARTSDCVLSYSTDVYVETFRGGELARIVVNGDGSTDLDLLVFDQNGILIAQDTDLTDLCIVEFVPRWTGPFRIEIRNLGRVYNCYTLEMN
jgi:hypothetical protein